MNLLETLRAFLQTHPAHIYLVGGAVRDVLLGREVHDLDLAVQGSASNLARAFADEIGAAYFLMDSEYDVARVILENADGTRDIVDFARLRGASIKKDLATRDFTANAIAADVRVWNGDAEQLIDPFHGRVDIFAHQVRAVSDKVFQNDPVRLLRAARMEAELDFVMDEGTEQLVRRDAPLIENAPAERVRDEFMKILSAPQPLRNLRRLDDLRLLGCVLTELNAMRDGTQSPPHIYDVFTHSLHAVAGAAELEHSDYGDVAQGAFAAQLEKHFSQITSAARTRRALLRLALLLHDIGKPATRSVEPGGRIRYFGHEQVGAEMAETALRRLKFSNDEIVRVKTILLNHLRPILLTQNGTSNRAIYRFFRDTGDIGVDVAVHSWCDQRATYGADSQAKELAELDAVIGRLLDRFYHARETVISPPPLLNGSDIMTLLQIPAGPRIGTLVEALREAQATGLVSTRDEAMEFIKKFDPPA